MKQKLVITLDEETTERYLKQAQQQTKGHIDADCEPIGCTISIDIESVIYDSIVYFNNKKIGQAEVNLQDI
jgi:hypothetical protein